MSAAACKAVICEEEAQGRMMSACNKIEKVFIADDETRIKHSEIYIKYIKKAQKEADALFDIS